jgi:uncharacterized protein YpbB
MFFLTLIMYDAAYGSSTAQIVMDMLMAAWYSYFGVSCARKCAKELQLLSQILSRRVQGVRNF